MGSPENTSGLSAEGSSWFEGHSVKVHAPLCRLSLHIWKWFASFLKEWVRVVTIVKCKLAVFTYLVGGNTMCVSTCQVEFVLRELSFFIRCSGDFSVLKRTVLLFNYYSGGRYRKLAGTTSLAFRIVFNCTNAESVLELVSSFQLACSSHRQETATWQYLIEIKFKPGTTFTFGGYEGCSHGLVLGVQPKVSHTLF